MTSRLGTRLGARRGAILRNALVLINNNYCDLYNYSATLSNVITVIYVTMSRIYGKTWSFTRQIRDFKVF